MKKSARASPNAALSAFLINPTRGSTERIGCSLCFIRIVIMTNKECIDRLAEQTAPAVFKAEDALQNAKSEFRERLAALKTGTSKEDVAKVIKEYRQAIARIIVMQAVYCVQVSTMSKP